MTDTISETQNLLDKLKSLSFPRSRPSYADTAKALMTQQTQDDVVEGVSSPMEVGEPTAELSAVVKDTSVQFELWETLAYDLALASTDPLTIASAYDLTTDQLQTLQENPYFTKILQAKKDEVKQLGSDATFAVKMRMVANRATPQLLRRLTDPSTANRDFLAMFKTVTELGQLIPQPNQDDSPQPTLIGASVTFNISGVPGLEHLATPIATNMQTSDLSRSLNNDNAPGLEHLSTVSQSSQTVIDAEFDEVVNELSTRQNKSDDELEEL